MGQPASAAMQHEVPIEVLPLEAGDHLTRCEFERRYHAMPELKKAELIEGVVYMPSPVRAQSHGEPHSHIITWLGVYRAATSGVQLLDNATLRLDLENEPQPDAILRIESEAKGRSRISEGDYLEGAPELIVEVAASSASYDLHDKLRAYRRNGVQEYIVWRVRNKKVDWFQLVNDEYILLMPDADGIVASRVFSGLRLAVSALLAEDLATVLSELQKGIGTSEHAAFIERLRGK